jgi:hypothetical protein
VYQRHLTAGSSKGYRTLFIPAIRQTRYTLFLNQSTQSPNSETPKTYKFNGYAGTKALVIEKTGRYTLPLTNFDRIDFSGVFVPFRSAFCRLLVMKLSED